MEDQEEGEISEDSDGGRKDSHRKKSHEHKKSKKKKKDKKSKKKKRRRRSSVGSASPTSSPHGRTKAELVAGDDEASTDREGEDNLVGFLTQNLLYFHYRFIEIIYLEIGIDCK